MSQQKIRSAGFTLIELMVVMTIVGILMAIGLVSFLGAGKNARNARRKSDIETVRQALVLYRSDTGCYPKPNKATDKLNFDQMVVDLSSGIGSQYLSSPLPQDPKNGVDSTAAYQYAPTGTCTGTQGSGFASGFSLTATLESDTTPTYTASNP